MSCTHRRSRSHHDAGQHFVFGVTVTPAGQSLLKTFLSLSRPETQTRRGTRSSAFDAPTSTTPPCSICTSDTEGEEEYDSPTDEILYKSKRWTEPSSKDRHRRSREETRKTGQARAPRPSSDSPASPQPGSRRASTHNDFNSPKARSGRTRVQSRPGTSSGSPQPQHTSRSRRETQDGDNVGPASSRDGGDHAQRKVSSSAAPPIQVVPGSYPDDDDDDEPRDSHDFPIGTNRPDRQSAMGPAHSPPQNQRRGRRDAAEKEAGGKSSADRQTSINTNWQSPNNHSNHAKHFRTHWKRNKTLVDSWARQTPRERDEIYEDTMRQSDAARRTSIRAVITARHWVVPEEFDKVVGMAEGVACLYFFDRTAYDPDLAAWLDIVDNYIWSYCECRCP